MISRHSPDSEIGVFLTLVSSWDPFPPTGLSHPALILGNVTGLIVACCPVFC